jgi:hypothetical protein
MFLRNLNVFVACLVVAGMTVAGPVALLVSIALRPLLGERGSGTYMYPIGYLVIGAVLAFAWWKVGLSPAQRKPEREGRFNMGHGVLAFTNVLAVAAIAGPILLAKISGNSNLAMLAWLALPVYALGFIAWPTGLFMVWSARA